MEWAVEGMPDNVHRGGWERAVYGPVATMQDVVQTGWAVDGTADRLYPGWHD